MKIAHLSDTHLGYRNYDRLSEKGVNQREADVQGVFRAALAQIEAADPDLIVHSGDVFHVVRPSNHALIATYRNIQEMQQRRKGRPFVIVGGNHDTARTSDQGHILGLFKTIEGVRVVATESEWIDLPELNTEVFGASKSFLAKERNNHFRSQAKRKHRVLVMHGLMQGVNARIGPSEADFAEEDVPTDQWTYIALGDFHIHKVYAPHACYAGSTDFTSTNVWEEKGAKGWVWFDTEVGRLELRALAPRRHIDLPWLDASVLTAKEVSERLWEACTWPKDELPVVRQKIVHVSTGFEREIDPVALRELRRYCLHLKWDRVPVVQGVRQEGEGAISVKPIEDSWDDHIAAWAGEPGLEKERVRVSGRTLIEEARTRAVEAA
jgi:DNA repair exonuclease SbcCD nuclease subunit